MTPSEASAARLSSPLRARRRTGRDAAPAAGWTWGIFRRIHLGTRKPENWMQLFKFGLVGGRGYVINLIVFAVLTGRSAIHHIAAAVLSFCVAVSNNFLLEPALDVPGHRGPRRLPGGAVLRRQPARHSASTSSSCSCSSTSLGPELPAQALAVAAAMPFNFLGNKLWTFGVDER